jgi:hypothetical protein
MDAGSIATLILVAMGLLTVATIAGILWFMKILSSKAGPMYDKMLQGPSLVGPALWGTARVVSLQTTGTSIERGGHPPAYQCQIGLRVEVPGSAPYDVAVRQFVPMFSIPALKGGANVPVQVDSANPHNIRIDLNQLPGLPANP